MGAEWSHLNMGLIQGWLMVKSLGPAFLIFPFLFIVTGKEKKKEQVVPCCVPIP